MAIKENAKVVAQYLEEVTYMDILLNNTEGMNEDAKKALRSLARNYSMQNWDIVDQLREIKAELEKHLN